MALHVLTEAQEPTGSDPESSSGEVVDLKIVRQVLTELFDPNKNETKQFELNVIELEETVADPTVIRTIAAHGAFNNQSPEPLNTYSASEDVDSINQGGNAA